MSTPTLRRELEQLFYWAESNSFKTSRAWLSPCDYPLEVYIRITERSLPQKGKRTPTIEIANISVAKQQRRKGIFTKFLEEIEQIAKEKHRTVYIEQVLQDWFFEWLQRYKGYFPVNSPDKSLLKEFKTEK